MFFWPHLELTDYEKRFNKAYGDQEKPGVLRRMYKVLLNNTQHAGVAGLEDIHLVGAVQISRSSRVFGLTFSGDTHAWRLKISTASGTEFTPRLVGGTYPMVSSLSPGASWNIAATDMAQPDNLTINAIPTRQIAWSQMPMIVEPNWELDPNEALFFEGEAQQVAPTALILEVGVHVWEFPGLIRGMDQMDKNAPPRMGGGPAISSNQGKGNC